MMLLAVAARAQNGHLLFQRNLWSKLHLSAEPFPQLQCLQIVKEC